MFHKMQKSLRKIRGGLCPHKGKREADLRLSIQKGALPPGPLALFKTNFMKGANIANEHRKPHRFQSDGPYSV